VLHFFETDVYSVAFAAIEAEVALYVAAFVVAYAHFFDVFGVAELAIFDLYYFLDYGVCFDCLFDLLAELYCVDVLACGVLYVLSGQVQNHSPSILLTVYSPCPLCDCTV
jgi:hypothetical protein